MLSFKEFVAEYEPIEEKMGKVGTAIAAGLLGAVAGHGIATHKTADPVPQEKIIKKETPKPIKKKTKGSESQNTDVDAGVIGTIAQM